MIPIILDCSTLCHKAKHTTGDLSTEEAKVGIIFGFFMQLLKLAKDYETNQFLLTWDSRKSHRVKLFPEYKVKRRAQTEKTPEEIEFDKVAYEQFDLLYEKYIPMIGFQNNVKKDGYEADDLIASYIHNSDPDQPFYIFSGDEDLNQLLYDNVSIINKNKKKKGVYTQADFEKEYGIGPELWADAKAYAGCASDGVPGISGIGISTAIKYLTNKLTPNMKKYQSIHCAEGKEIYRRNMPLVKLPFFGCPQLEYKPDYSLSLDGFMSMCQELDFQYFLDKERLSEWKKYLNMR